MDDKPVITPPIIKKISVAIIALGIIGGVYLSHLGFGPDAVGCPAFQWCKDASYRLWGTLLPFVGVFLAIIWWLLASLVIAIKIRLKYNKLKKSMDDDSSKTA